MVNTHLRVADEVVKSEAPQDLIGQVGGPGLGRVPSRLDHRVQGHDDLEGGGQNVLGRHLPERALLVYPEKVLDDLLYNIYSDSTHMWTAVMGHSNRALSSDPSN